MHDPVPAHDQDHDARLAAQLRRQRELVSAHIADENAGRWEAVMASFGAGAASFYDVAPLSAHLPGLDGVRQAYGILLTALPDVHITVTGAYDAPGCSVREITLSGTHRGEYCGVPASGKVVRVEVACFFLFHGAGEDVVLVGERVYYDNETLLRQMRGEPGAPTGIGLASR